MKNSQILEKQKIVPAMPDCQIIILAAGNGSRMSSDLPKVMHMIGGKPMIERVLDNCGSVSDDIILVYSSTLLEYLTPYKHLCKLALQKEPKGTAHAVAAAKEYIDNSKPVMVIYGDNPLITPSIILDLAKHQHLTESAVVTLAFHRDNPAQYGRIVTDAQGNFLKIVEHKDADADQKEIKLCNSGIMAFAPGILEKYLPACLDEQLQERELYLTKIIEVCADAGEKVSYFTAHDADLVVGVNTQEELQEASKVLKNQHMD